MSVFICNDKTINRIVTFLVRFDDQYGVLEEPMEKFGLDDWKAEPHELGKTLKELNCDSVSQRYNEPLDVQCVEDYEYDLETCDIYQAIMHLHCLMYQSCEGNCELREEYKALKEITKHLEHRVVFDKCNELNCEWEAK